MIQQSGEAKFYCDRSGSYAFKCVISDAWCQGGSVKSIGRDSCECYQPQAFDPDPDQDGVLSPEDKCPNHSEDKDGFEDGDGCPEDGTKPDTRNVCEKGQAVSSDECRRRCDALCAGKRGTSSEGHFCSDSGEGRKACINGDPGPNCPRCNDAAFLNQ